MDMTATHDARRTMTLRLGLDSTFSMWCSVYFLRARLWGYSLLGLSTITD